MTLIPSAARFIVLSVSIALTPFTLDICFIAKDPPLPIDNRFVANTLYLLHSSPFASDTQISASSLILLSSISPFLMYVSAASLIHAGCSLNHVTISSANSCPSNFSFLYIFHNQDSYEALH